MIQERRATHRLPIERKVWLRTASTDAFWPAVTVDVDARGAQLRLPAAIRPGTSVDLNLKLNPHEVPVSVQAEVAWAGEGRLGLRFLNVGAVDRMRLERWNHAQALLIAG